MNNIRDLNLKKIPNTNRHYVTKGGAVLKLDNAYFDVSVNKFVFTENGERRKLSQKKAKELYRKLSTGFNNTYVFRDCLSNLDLSDKDINKLLYKTSKKFRQHKLWNIQHEIIHNKMKLVVLTDLTFKRFYDKLLEEINNK